MANNAGQVGPAGVGYGRLSEKQFSFVSVADRGYRELGKRAFKLRLPSDVVERRYQ